MKLKDYCIYSIGFRASFLIQYSFYKNIAFCTAQFFFMFFSNYSANSVFESYFLVKNINEYNSNVSSISR